MFRSLVRRLRAERKECAFWDIVVGREVWVYEYKGEQWLGHSRLGMWMKRQPSREELLQVLNDLRSKLADVWADRVCAVPDGGCGACWVCRLEKAMDEAVQELLFPAEDAK